MFFLRNYCEIGQFNYIVFFIEILLLRKKRRYWECTITLQY